MRSRLWPLLALPGLVWLAAFFLVAFYAIVSVGLGNVTDALRAGPALEPAGLERRLPLAGDQGRRARAAQTWHVFVRTLLYVFVAVALSLAIGYPVACYARAPRRRRRGLVLVAARAAVLDLAT